MDDCNQAQVSAEKRACPVCQLSDIVNRDCGAHEVLSGLEICLRKLDIHTLRETGWLNLPASDAVWRFKRPEPLGPLPGEGVTLAELKPRRGLGAVLDSPVTYLGIDVVPDPNVRVEAGQLVYQPNPGKGDDAAKKAFVGLAEKRIKEAEAALERQVSEWAYGPRPGSRWYDGYDVIPCKAPTCDPVPVNPAPVREPPKPVTPMSHFRSGKGRPHEDPCCACTSCRSYDHP